MNDIFHRIKEAFGALWHMRARGERTLEITMPIATSTDMFVTVFITKRENDYVVTDGAWICSKIYGEGQNDGHFFFQRALDYYKGKYDIQEVCQGDKLYYYKKIGSLELLPGIVFDLSHFISAVVSNSDIPLTLDRKEEVFKKKAQRFLLETDPEVPWEFDRTISPDLKIKFNAVLRREEEVSLINFVSGSNSSIYTSALCRADTQFSMVFNQSNIKIGKSILFYDDEDSKQSILSLPGVQQYIDHVRRKTNDNYHMIPWGNRDRVRQQIAI